jgi:hypothetical protein
VVAETPGHAGRHHQHTGDLHEDGEAVDGVVGVVGRGEPGEVHPEPPDPEEDQREGDEDVAGVILDEAVMEALGRLGDGDDERQVKEEFKGGGGPVGLRRVAPDHRHMQLHVRILRSDRRAPQSQGR